MVDFFGSVLALVVALGILIAVHEYGHFLIARLVGVKVLRFSIGFGKPLWSRRAGADGTEYVLAAIPLGGYVKMLDEREGEVAEHELHRAFNRQSVPRRFAVVAAGPLFNFMFAIFAFWLMFVTGVPGVKAIIGEVEAGTPADRAGLRSGQQIVAVGDEPTPTWGAVLETVLPKALTGGSVTLAVETETGDVVQKRMQLDWPGPDLKPEEIVTRIGWKPFQPRLQPLIGDITPGSPAEAAGLRSGDVPVSVAGNPVETIEGFIDVVRQHPGKPVRLEVLRDGEHIRMTVTPERIQGEDEEGPVGRIGAAITADPQALAPYRAEWRHGPLQAVASSTDKTWEMATLTLRMLGEMLVGRASVENISGPITIARFAKESAFAGLTRFLSFLAIVSISLGVLNLLPIPVLDGGHLMFYVVEALKGSPVSEHTEAVGQRIGIAIIIVLMTLAFYNDLARLAG